MDFEFTSPEGKTYTVSGPEGSTREQAFSRLQAQLASAAPMGPPASAAVDPPAPPGVLPMIGRQLGLTARYALEGPADAASVLTEPIRYATDRLLGTTGKTKSLGGLASGLAD